MGSILIDSIVYALDEAELKGEVEKTYQELKTTDPEAAQEFIREYREAVKSGEITVEKTDVERAKEGAVEGEGRFSEAENSKMKTEFDTLVKEGKTPQEAEKIMREKYGEPEGQQDFDLSKPEDRVKALENLDKDSAFLKEKGLSDDDISQLKDAIARGDEGAEIFDKLDKMGLDHPEEGRGPGDFERMGPPEGMERFGSEGQEISKEEMTERFREEMGREPTESERGMMEKGEFDRPEFDRPEFERAEFDRPEFERPEFERPEYERPEREFDLKEGPQPPPPPPEPPEPPMPPEPPPAP